jgi:hypothetical protein
VPAKYANVIAVSAIDNASTIAPFSKSGPRGRAVCPGCKCSPRSRAGVTER